MSGTEATSPPDQAIEIVRQRPRIALIGCSSTKQTTAAPARDLYISQLFRKSVAYAEATCDRWYILSAKHGLVHPDQTIEPYDMRLGVAVGEGERRVPPPPIEQWSAKVRTQMDLELRDVPAAHLIVLAGAIYEVAVTARTDWSYETPLKGLGIGYRLQWLTRAINDTPEPLPVGT